MIAVSEGSAYAAITLITTIKAARDQVAFSRKSVVFLTPMIWFEEAKPAAKPPPFEF